MSLDLNILPIHRTGGQDRVDLPGLAVAERPRRIARSRRSDQLILYIGFIGKIRISESQLPQLLGELSNVYYQAPGSVTSAFRAVVESLNERMLSFNSKRSGDGEPLKGLLLQIVRRDDQIYIAQSGPARVYRLSSEGITDIYNPGLSGSGLGLSSAAQARFFHSTLQANDTILVAEDPTSPWSEELVSSLYGQGPEGIRRRLLAKSPMGQRAFVIQAKIGSGKVHIMHSQATAQVTQHVVTPLTGKELPAQTDSELDLAQGGLETGVHKATETDMASVDKIQAVPVVGGTSYQESSSPATQSSRESPIAPGREVADLNRGYLADSEQPYAKPDATGCSFLLLPIRFILRPFVYMLQGLASFMNRLIPGELFENIPNSVFASVAIVVPILIVVVATIIYIQRGVSIQSQVVYEQALELAAQAENETDLLSKRDTWLRLLDHLDGAESLYPVPGASELRERAQSAIDRIDLVYRADYQPTIIGGVSEGVIITSIILGDDELFLLDVMSGKALHAILTDQGYRLNENFLCGPGAAGVESPLIDIVAWPVEFDPRVSLLGITQDGQAMYCHPGQAPAVEQLTRPDSSDLNNLAGATMGLGDLYVLDPDANAVWIYPDGNFAAAPIFYFGDQIPKLEDVVDLVVNNDELYLLHSDGILTLCQFSWLDVSPTSCIEPITYIDTRQERQNKSLTPEYPFSQLYNNPPPDPSLYFLEPVNHSIYHFSLRSPTFQRQYRPLLDLSQEPATAFVVDSFDRLLFLAIENDLYYARIP